MVNPLCPYFGSCGGCSAQNVSYENQLENKKRHLASCINLDLTEASENKNFIKVFSDKEYFYRNRMDMVFGPRGVGLRKKGDWKTIIDIDSCVISDERLNALIKEIREHFKDVDYFDIRKNQGTFRYVVIRTPVNTSSISFVLNEDSTKTGEAIDKIKHYAKSSTAENIIVTYVPKHTDISISDEFFVVKGNDMLTETYLNKTFYYSVQGFFQNNTAIAEKMHEHVRSIIKNHNTKDMTLLDLYAGVGTFGINNAEFFNNVSIVESDKNCVNAARKNIEFNKADNAEIIELDAMQLKKVELPAGEKLFVITDPPRSGMHPKTIEQLNKLRPDFMIYISCNVEQLGKDLAKFKDYELKSVAMFDLFPQTPHIEAIVELVLKH